MKCNHVEISVDGKPSAVPSTCIEGRTVIITGRWIKIARVHDEEWLEGDIVENPETFVARLKQSKTGADLFTFTQKLPEVRSKHNYAIEWDNVAAIPITTFKDWLEKRVEYDVRKAVKKAAKLGVVVKAAAYTQEFIRGIQGIYNESPLRAGNRFWHYGKDFETVKKENSTYLDRSEYIGAYFENKLIGFIRMVYVDKIARTLQVIAKNEHFEKKPTNALIAKAVEICAQKGMAFLVYDKYDFGRKGKSSFTEFKRRNGFEEIRFPRYYIPITLKGEVALKLKLHNGITRFIPGCLKDVLSRWREKVYKLKPVQWSLHRPQEGN